MKNVSTVEKLTSTLPDGRLDLASRVKNFIAGSPSRLRRAMSLGATCVSTQVFGVSLLELMAREERDQQVPFIVRKIVQHLKINGLDEEGLYRINGNSKLIEKLKTSFDKVGDANFDGVDIAAIAGLLKLFLRELKTPVVPEEIAPEFVLIQQAHPREATPEALHKMRQSLAKLPATNLAVLKYLIEHLVEVSQHISENKMTAVSLSIVFGPNFFRCPQGVEGLLMQGHSNSIVCKMIKNHTKLFDLEEVEEAVVKRKRVAPFKPRPYSEHVALKKPKEEDDVTDAQRPLSPVDTSSLESRERSYSEQSIDEAIERSTPSPMPDDVFQDIRPTTPKSPPSQEPLVIEPGNEPQHGSDEESSRFQRRYAKRGIKFRPKAMEGTPTEESTITMDVARSPSEPAVQSKQLRHTQLAVLASREDELMRTPSPCSWQSSPGTSPPTSPSNSLTPATSRVVNAVIGDSVKQFLFEPHSPPNSKPATEVVKHRADVYGLLLPDNALQKWDKINQSAYDSVTPPQKTNSEAQVDVSALEVPAVKRRKGGLDARRQRNRKSALFGQEYEADHALTSPIEEMDVQILSVSPQSSDHVTQGSDHVTVESRVGRVSDLAKYFEQNESEVKSAPPTHATATGKTKKRATSTAFEMFERSGIIMGMPAPAKPQVTSITSDDQGQDDKPMKPSILGGSEDLTALTPQISRSTVSDEDVFASPDHQGLLSDGSAGKQKRRQEQLSTTTSDDVFVSPRRTPASDDPDSSSTVPVAATHDDFVDGPTDSIQDESLDDFDAVKTSGTLHHITLSRPKGPARSKPRSRAVSSPEISKPITATPDSNDEVDYHHPSKSASDSVERIEVEAVARIKSSTREQRRKSTKLSAADSPRRAKRHRHSEPAAPLSNQTSSKLGRVPLLDLISLAPESQARSAVKEGWAGDSGTSILVEQNEGRKDDDTATAKQLSHRIHELKGIAREFEADFTAKHGHKPSGSEKNSIRSQLEELTKLRRQFKEMKERQSETKLSQTAPPEISTNPTTTTVDNTNRLAKTSAGSTTAEVSPRDARKRSNARESRVSSSDGQLPPNLKLGGTLVNLMSSLDQKRRRYSQSSELHDMSQEQLLAEKQSLQKALLQFEKHNGRPQTKEDKETMRPLYDRYRLVKKLIASSGSKSQERPSIVSITSQEALGTTADSLPSVTLLQSGLAKSLPPPQISASSSDHTAKLSKSATALEPQQSEEVLPAAETGHVSAPGKSETELLFNERQLGDASCEELFRQKELALEVKKKLRKVLKDFETTFINLHGRSVNKDDRKPMQKEYKDYKNVKAKLQMIDVLIAKKEPPKTL